MKNRKSQQRNRRNKQELNGNFRTENTITNLKLSRWTQQQSGRDRYTEQRINKLKIE